MENGYGYKQSTNQIVLIKNSGLQFPEQPDCFWKKDIIFKMHMLYQIVVEFIQPLKNDTMVGAGIGSIGIVVGQCS